jgi:hypothetical protein
LFSFLEEVAKVMLDFGKELNPGATNSAPPKPPKEVFAIDADEGLFVPFHLSMRFCLFLKDCVMLCVGF